MSGEFRRLEINGGQAIQDGGWLLRLDPIKDGYADAQIDDYGGRKRSAYPWGPETRLALRARFSHEAGVLVGTAGFGFWNAPFGDPTVRRPALPQAAWFFYASEPSDLPFPEDGPGRGWFAGTMDISAGTAATLTPLALPIVVGNNISPLRRRLWPWLRRRLGVSYAPIPWSMTEWHQYRLEWGRSGCQFYVDDEPLLETPQRPRGPLGFVCWLDNQFMAATPRGRFRWGTLKYPEEQWLRIEDLRLEQGVVPL